MRRFLLSFVFLLPLPAYCWWETGHQVVARIAVMHLKSEALRRVAHILDVSDTPDAVANALAQASLWADETKKDTNTGNWHYIDITLQDQRSDMPKRCENDNCVTARLRQFTGQLAAHSGNQLDALRYVTHFIGDIHQPLHDISDADQGGNCEVLDPPIASAKNLHSLWDGEIVNSFGMSDTVLAADLSREIDSLPADREAQIVGGNTDDWVWEGHLLAQKEIYTRLNLPVADVVFPSKCTDAPSAITSVRLHIEPSYMDAMKPVVREQLEKAGLRLARVLNDSLEN